MPIAEEPNISLYPFCALALPNMVLTAGLHTFFAGYILLFMVGRYFALLARFLYFISCAFGKILLFCILRFWQVIVYNCI